MDTTTRLHDLMAADLEVHMEQAQIMRRGNRLMAAATITLAIILTGSLAGGWWVIQAIQEQNAETLEMMRQTVVMRI